ncbi:formyltetrahydrofolate-dependent phosphoribosylglycinamide formyltransferase [Mesobacillus persicus]|uniref:Phosphoribosylglycinamide formyltransferase n=1 Tax=Mesobacillus persicus TaxID=930146 RepID=A0A1H8CBK0_9BACI|nr:phosphoribosylglycinamide formyltransferase [Mesobacillus persicus]SEM92390.1 formyltetrahydrofolate-dependent phosphoribosylglycinamide formyltransferase [Mesobacillus persicus]
MKKMAIFASGNGSNFQVLIDAIRKGDLQAEVSLLVCDRPGAYVIERAVQEGVSQFVFQPKSYQDKADYETEILGFLKGLEVDLIVLAGYMRLIGPTLLQAYEGKIINIHPSLLPAFPGKDAIGQALAAGVSQTGATVHYVDAGMDTGEIIAQQSVEVLPGESRETLQDKIQQVEHELYPTVVKMLLNGMKEATPL